MTTAATTDRTRAHGEHPDTEPVDGGWGTQFPFSQPGDWVALADVSHGAKALYYVYCGHVNKRKNGDAVWPSQATLANILRVTEKTIRKWIVELEQIRAIIVTEIIDPRNGHKRLFVEVNQAAPAGYDGYVDYTTYYDDQKKLRQAVKGTLIEVADASEPRTPPVKNTEGQGKKVPVDTDQAKHEPPVKSTEGHGSKSTGGQGSKSTDEEDEVKKTKERTHTPASTETTSEPTPEAETRVCEQTEDATPNPHQHEARELLNSIIDRTAARRMLTTERDKIIAAVAALLNDGHKPSLIAAQLTGCVNAETDKPYALLYQRCTQIANEGPSSATAAQTDLWGTATTTPTTHETQEIAPGVVEIKGEPHIRYSSCGGRDCTGGAQGMTGTWRRRYDTESGNPTGYCDTEVTLPDGRTTTCHPDARKEQPVT